MNVRLGTGGAFAAALLALVAMLVVPLPPWFLDLLLALDIMGAAVVLVIAVSLTHPLEFAAFPTLLLVATLFRLSLDVSATRLILTQGAEPGGVGTVIPAFGQFVMRGNVVVGLLIFIILVIVQLLVVTNGAQRVAEVAARFTLDAMPGKQMAIDADLHAGLIDVAQAKARRSAIQSEADFYGAMDGAGKFVRGDAVAALVIVAVNIVAGIAIGVIGRHMDVGTAAQTFTLLSAGNALATTLPAFLLSTAMGVMVTRASTGGNLGEDIVAQILAHPRAITTVGWAMIALALVPGLPHVAFGVLGVTGLAGGRAARHADERRRFTVVESERLRDQSQASKPEGAIALIGVDQLGIDVGEALLPLLDEPAGSVLLRRIGSLRRSLALELGVILPGVHVRDDLRLPERGFAIRVRDRVVARGQIHSDRALAIAPVAELSKLPGEATQDPVTGSDAKWLASEATSGASAAIARPVGEAIIVDPIGVLTSKLGMVVRDHAAALLGRQEVQALLDHVRRTNPAVVKGVVPELAGLGLVQRVLAQLVGERVSIRDLVTILETIANEAEHTKEADTIAEAARRKLAPAICASLADELGVIRVAALTAASESLASASLVVADRGSVLALDPATAHAFAQRLAAAMRESGVNVLVCAPSLRVAIARFVEMCGLRAAVLSLAEVAPGFAVEIATTIELPA